MKFAIAIPQFYADGEFDPKAFREYLARAEELGFESAWLPKGVKGGEGLRLSEFANLRQLVDQVLGR